MIVNSHGKPFPAFPKWNRGSHGLPERRPPGCAFDLVTAPENEPAHPHENSGAKNSTDREFDNSLTARDALETLSDVFLIASPDHSRGYNLPKAPEAGGRASTP